MVVSSLFCADEIKSKRENGWYARRSERDGRLSSAKIRRGRRASRRRRGTSGRTSFSRLAAPRRGCWNPPTPVALPFGAPAGPPPPPMSWCSLLRNPWPGGPPRGNWTAVRNGPLLLGDSTENRAKVSRYIPSNTDWITRIHRSSPKTNRQQGNRWCEHSLATHRTWKFY